MTYPLSTSFKPKAFVKRAIKLLPYLTFADAEQRKLFNISEPWSEEHLKCVGKAYETTWKIRNKGNEDGWFLLDENKSDLSKEEFEKLKQLCFLVHEFALEKATELFPSD